MSPMAANLSHFAINADDVEASRAFYTSVFGWSFTPWGPPDFYQIHTSPDGQPGVLGALQHRRRLLPGRETTGLECAFAVEDLPATRDRVVSAGGRILMERSTIAGVGHLLAFEDPSGNIILAMQYTTDA